MAALQSGPETFGDDLFHFLYRYATLVELQLQAVQADMADTVVRVTECVRRIEELTEAGKEKAEAALLDSSLRPDAETEAALVKAQSAVDDIFAEAMREIGEERAKDEMPLVDATERRRGGVFSKNVEALSRLATDLVEPLVAMMGTLSAGDAIDQALSKTLLVARAMTSELSRLIEDGGSKPQSGHFSDRQSRLMDVVAQQLTTPGERALVRDAFADAPQIDSREAHLVVSLSFLGRYNRLLKLQLQLLQQDLRAELAGAMSTLMGISDIAEWQKKHADTLLIKGSSAGGLGGSRFVEASLKDRRLAEQNGASLRMDGPSAAKLSQPIDLLNDVDRELGNFLTELMGELSIENVIGQRLEHAIAALAGIEKLITVVSGEPGSHPKVQSVETLSTSLLTQVFGLYTMESEKECFRKVFGDLRTAR